MATTTLTAELKPWPLAPGWFNARADILAQAIRAETGVDADIAQLGAGSFLSFRGDSWYGLGDPPVGHAMRFGKAFHAVRVWDEARQLRADPAYAMAAE